MRKLAGKVAYAACWKTRTSHSSAGAGLRAATASAATNKAEPPTHTPPMTQRIVIIRVPECSLRAAPVPAPWMSPSGTFGVFGVP